VIASDVLQRGRKSSMQICYEEFLQGNVLNLGEKFCISNVQHILMKSNSDTGMSGTVEQIVLRMGPPGEG
jgi:hypothetical protein